MIKGYTTLLYLSDICDYHEVINSWCTESDGARIESIHSRKGKKHSKK